MTSTTLFRARPPQAKYLLILNKGPGAEVLQRQRPVWDLMEIYFMRSDIENITRTPNLTDADYVVFETDRNMRKFSIIKSIFEKHDFWRRYDAVMMADDDLVPVGCSIASIFDLFMQTGLRVGQPALSANSYWSHEITLQNPAFLWRKTNFAEVMCPIMTPAAILDYMPLFDATVSNFGLDNCWSLREWRAHGGLALLDATPMHHKRPIGGGMAYQNLAPIQDRRVFSRNEGIRPYFQQTLGGVSSAGSQKFNKRRIFYRTQAVETVRTWIKDLWWLWSSSNNDTKKN